MIRNIYPELHIAILTAQPEKVYYNVLLKYAITYFISKSTKSEEIARTLDEFFRNERIVRQDVKIPDPFARIAPREFQILNYWLQGINTKEIARLLRVTMSTVSTVKVKILDKTNTTNFVELNELANLYKIGQKN